MACIHMVALSNQLWYTTHCDISRMYNIIAIYTLDYYEWVCIHCRQFHSHRWSQSSLQECPVAVEVSSLCVAVLTQDHCHPPGTGCQHLVVTQLTCRRESTRVHMQMHAHIRMHTHLLISMYISASFHSLKTTHTHTHFYTYFFSEVTKEF